MPNWGDFPEPLGMINRVDPQLEQIIQRLPPLLNADGGLKVHVQNAITAGGSDTTEATQLLVKQGIGTTADAEATTTGSVIGWLKKISGVLAGTLNVNIVSGATAGLTDTQLRATPVPVSGPITDTQLRAASVPVSGPLTDAQLRNSAVPTTVTSLPLPTGAASEISVALAATALGAPGDAAATTTGSVIAQIRRVANLLAGTLTVSGTVAVSGSVSVTGPITDTQLRASAVPVSAASLPLPTGAATETTLAAANTAVGTTADAASTTTGTVIAHLRKIRDLLTGTLTVNVGLTDTQLRASAVPVSIAATVAVSGPLTDTQLRNTAVPVSLASVPSHPVTNAGTFAVQDVLADTALGAPADAAATTTGSVIAQLRRVANLLAATLTVSGTVAVSGSVAVTGTFWQATQPVSGPLTDTQLRASAVPISAASLPLPTGASLDSTLTGGTQKSIVRGGAKGATTAADVTSTASGADHQPLDAALYDASGNRLGTSGTPLRTDPTGGTTQPVSAVSLPLPTGAATETSVALSATALGAPADAAATTTGSVIAQLRRIANLLAGTVAVSGVFWQTTQPVSAASLPLPTGASTEATLASLLTTAGATGDAAATGAGTMNAHLRSIAAALAGTLTVTGGTSATQFAEDSVHVSGDVGTMSLAVRKDTAIALAGTDGDYIPLIVDASGKLHVNIGAGPFAVTGTFWQATQPVSAASLPLPTGASTETTVAAVLAILGASGDAASSTTGTVNAHLRSIAAALAGTLTVGSHAVTNAGTFAVQADTELPAAAALADATANPTTPVVGSFAHIYNGTTWDRARGDITNGLDVDVTRQVLPTGASTETTLAALLATAGATSDAAGTGAVSMNAHLRSIATALAGTLTVTGGGGGTQFAEDAAHVSGDLGTMALGVRKDAATALAGTDGDYQPAIFDASGRMWVNPSGVTQPISAASLPLPTGAAADTSLGSLTETAPTTDTASSGLNGRAQRIAQRITSLIALLPTSLGQKTMANGLAVTIASDQSAIPVTGTISVSGTMPVVQTYPATGTTSTVAGSASSVQLLASNANRRGCVIVNDSTAVLKVKFGTTASATDYTYYMAGSVSGVPSTLELPEINYTGRIDGIWASATGNARITEITP